MFEEQMSIKYWSFSFLFIIFIIYTIFLLLENCAEPVYRSEIKAGNNGDDNGRNGFCCDIDDR